MQKQNNLFSEFYEYLKEYQKIHNNMFEEDVLMDEDFTEKEIYEQIETCLLLNSLDDNMVQYTLNIMNNLMKITEISFDDCFFSLLSFIQLMYYRGEEMMKLEIEEITVFMGVYLKTSRNKMLQTIDNLLSPEIYYSIIEQYADDVSNQYFAFVGLKEFYEATPKLKKEKVFN